MQSLSDNGTSRGRRIETLAVVQSPPQTPASPGEVESVADGLLTLGDRRGVSVFAGGVGNYVVGWDDILL